MILPKFFRAVTGHFKMHHLWSLQSAPLRTGCFLMNFGLADKVEFECVV